MKTFYATVKACLLLSLFAASSELRSQTIGTFNSVAPGVQTQNLVIPPTHTFQRIIRAGDALTAGGTLAANGDFTGYVPIAGSSRNGYLSISGENTVASVATMTVNYNYTTHTWNKSNSGNVNFLVPALQTVSRFCSGTVTPNGTIMVSEESLTAGDNNTDGYQDVGWIIEIDPATRTVMESDASHTGVDKVWAIGRQSRENVVIASDNKTLYTGADDPSNGFVYKFVANTAGNFSSGQLYVLVTTGALGTGTWNLIANTTQADRNGTVALSNAQSAYNFNGVEDIEISPLDGKVYFTAKGPGRVYRFTDNGATVSNLQVFVANTTYDVDPGPGVANEAWGIGNDNLAFDSEGNLWVLQDGDRNHIWVVGPTHTAGTPAVRLFGKTPAGSEPTGITFTPDYKFMFISIQHPNAGNSTTLTDAAGVVVTFNTHMTLVIARIEDLGPFATLPLTIENFDVKEENSKAKLNWSVVNAINHAQFEIERSTDGRNFEKIHTDSKTINNGGASHKFDFTDNEVPVNTLVYYRIKQVDTDGRFHYSETKSIRIDVKAAQVSIYPIPAVNKLNIDYTALQPGNIIISVIDGLGRKLIIEKKVVSVGKNVLTLNVQKLSKGNYTLDIFDGANEQQLHQFSKL